MIYPTWLENGMELCLDVLDHLLRALPVYELSCRPDEEAVALTEKTIFGENRKIHICAGFFDGTDHVYKIAEDTI